jgi:preprotein translocase subunit SecD
VAPPRNSGSKPGRALALLAALIVVMLLGIIAPNIGSPGKWHQDFKVTLGLDLSSGTQATLRAVTLKGGKNPPSDLMQQAVAIINNRVNASGSTGVSVQQEGSTDIQVTAPGQGSQQLINNVDTTAQLRFRAVLLEGSSTAAATPSASATTSPSPSASASSTSSAKSKASPSASTKAHIEHAAATPSPSVQAGSTASAKASSSATPAASASASPSPTGSAATTAGNPSAVNAATMKLFDKLDCSNLNTWKTKLGYNEQQWDDPGTQTVACGPSNVKGGPNVKYVLDKAVILGTDVTNEAANIDTTSNQWVVNLSLNSRAANAFKELTSTQATKYTPNASTNSDDAVLAQTAIVLDGNVISAPQTTETIPNGQVQITNIGGEAAATQLASQLKYGALPLTFKVVNTTTVTAQLGKNQLDAGLIAGGIGLILVVIYSFFYYRGLGSVSVSSLAIAALLGYLSVVLLSKYQGFTLSLTGVAGLIVAIGITADSFVVFFERLRDEVRDGRSLRAAVESGWRRARRTILVSDTVSFLAALLLYIFSVGDVKGFAYTLGLTTLIDVIVVFLFTKPMVTILARTKFFGQGHKWSGLDPARLGARAPWRSGVPRRSERTTGRTTGRTSGRAGGSGPGRTSRTTSREA